MLGYDGGVEAPSCYRSGSVGGCEIQIMAPDYRTGIICSWPKLWILAQP